MSNKKNDYRDSQKRMIRRIIPLLKHIDLCSINGYDCLLINLNYYEFTQVPDTVLFTDKGKSVSLSLDKLWCTLNKVHADFIIYYWDDLSLGVVTQDLIGHHLLKQLINKHEIQGEFSTITDASIKDPGIEIVLKQITSKSDLLLQGNFYIIPIARYLSINNLLRGTEFAYRITYDGRGNMHGRGTFPISMEPFVRRTFRGKDRNPKEIQIPPFSKKPRLVYKCSNFEEDTYDLKPGNYINMYDPNRTLPHTHIHYQYSNMYIWWYFNTLIHKGKPDSPEYFSSTQLKGGSFAGGRGICRYDPYTALTLPASRNKSDNDFPVFYTQRTATGE